MMNPGNEIRNEHPDKVTVVRHHLTAIFGQALRESEEFETDCLLFRTPSGGFVALPDTVFEDYTAQEIKAKLEATGLIERIKRLAKGERFIVRFDPSHEDVDA